LRYHPLDDDLAFGLTDRPGAMQAFAVAASPRPLPAFEQWSKRRAARVWQRFPTDGGVVWSSDGEVSSRKIAPNRTRGQLDAEIKRGRLLPRLCRSLKVDGVEAVTAVAFAVVAKEGQ
jgi:hypothetical protein